MASVKTVYFGSAFVVAALFTIYLWPVASHAAQHKPTEHKKQEHLQANRSNKRLFRGWAENPLRPQVNNPRWQRAYDSISRASTVRPTKLRAPKVLQSGNPKEKLLALTIDDGPHTHFTPRLLQLLRDLNVKATFFVIGKMAETRATLVRKIDADGHLIGNHSFSHVTLTKLTELEVRTEYRATNDVLQQILGKSVRFCRPPGGDRNREVLNAAADEGMTTVLWTDDPGDYANPGVDVIVNKAITRMSNGGIILLHDGVEQTLVALPKIVEYARKNGYKFVTVDELEKSQRGTSVNSKTSHI